MVNTLPQLVILLMTDQFRYDAFNPSVTPNLYNKLSLAANATMFTNAYVSTPICTPSRAGLLTGKSPWNHGMLGYGYTVNCSEYPTTLPSIMKELGYQTFAVGKNHFGWNATGGYVGHGFDHLKVYDALSNQPYPDEYMKYFDHLHPGVDPLSETCCGGSCLQYNDWSACPYGLDDESQHPTPWTTRQALEYLENFDFDNSNEKMFLKVSYHRPHSPYDPPARLLDKRMEGWIPRRFINNTSWDVQFLNTTDMPNAAWFGDPGETPARHSRSGYLASCEFVDEGMGQLFDWLKEHGMWDSSLIVWTTDHGDMNGDHNLWRKGYPWEQDTHVNLIVKLPAVSSSSSSSSQTNDEPVTSDALVETRDIAVTLYDYLGYLQQVKEKDSLVNGKSLLPLLLPGGSNGTVRTWLDLELSVTYRRDIHWNAIVGSYKEDKHACGKWKYIFNVWKGNEQLFCLTSDPNETYDLATVQEYEDALVHWRETMVTQFETEKRGERFVKDGKLVAGRDAIVFATNFPCGTHFPLEQLMLDGDDNEDGLIASEFRLAS